MSGENKAWATGGLLIGSIFFFDGMTAGMIFAFGMAFILGRDGSSDD